MIHKQAEKLTEICFARNWIDMDQREWCIYALEKWIGIFIFFSTVLVYSLVSKRMVEVLSFLAPFYFLRRRIGGCHASTQLLCFCISVSLVVFVSAFLGEALLQIPKGLLYVLDIAVVVTAFLLSPAYPPQLHFTEHEKRANNHKKNIILILLLAAQALLVLISRPLVFSCSFCGITFAVVTVVLQKMKGDNENEES